MNDYEYGWNDDDVYDSDAFDQWASEDFLDY